MTKKYSSTYYIKWRHQLKYKSYSWSTFELMTSLDDVVLHTILFGHLSSLSVKIYWLQGSTIQAYRDIFESDGDKLTWWVVTRRLLKTFELLGWLIWDVWLLQLLQLLLLVCSQSGCAIYWEGSSYVLRTRIGLHRIELIDKTLVNDDFSILFYLVKSQNFSKILAFKVFL